MASAVLLVGASFRPPRLDTATGELVLHVYWFPLKQRISLSSIDRFELCGPGRSQWTPNGMYGVTAHLSGGRSVQIYESESLRGGCSERWLTWLDAVVADANVTDGVEP